MITLFIFKCTLVELIAEFFVIIKIINNSNTLCCSVNDADVQAATKQRSLSTAQMKYVSFVLNTINSMGMSAGEQRHVSF